MNDSYPLKLVSFSILKFLHLPVLKALEMKLEFGQIIVWVWRAIILSILSLVFVITVLFCAFSISSTLKDA